MSIEFRKKLLTYLKAEFTLFHIETGEVQELRDDVEDACKQLKKSLFLYTPEGRLTCKLFKGKKDTSTERLIKNFNQTTKNTNCSLDDLLIRLRTEPGSIDVSNTSIPTNSVVILTGISLELPVHSQAIIEGVACNIYRANKLTVICTDPIISIPDCLRRYTTLLTYEMPTEAELRATLQVSLDNLKTALKLKAQKNKKAMPTNVWFLKSDLIDKVVRQMVGMTVLEATNTLNLCIVQYPADATIRNVLNVVAEQKTAMIQRSYASTIVPLEEQPDRAEIGGYERLIDFINVRAQAYSPKAKSFGIDPPRGIILLGLPGTGKSMIARAIGKMMQLPVISMDISSIFNSYVGVSEARIKQELARIDAINGCVLVLNEADKSFPNVNTDGEDSGVTRRVFGTLLNWLQEHKSHTFTVVTMNDPENIPPEFLRAGRFDEIFFSGLPTDKERMEILKAHLHKRNAMPYLSDADWEQIIKNTKNFVGSELESVIIDARYLAFTSRNTGTPDIEDILNAISQRKPLYDFQRDKMDKLLKNYSENAVSTGY